MSGPAPRWTLCLLTLPSACIEKPLIESMPEIGFSVVSTGRDHACGLAETAEIYCWSRTNPRPTLVSNDVSFTTVATFWDHTCGIALDGAAYCWGLSSVGQLGAAVEDLETCGVAAGGTAPCSRVPIPVAGNLRFTWLTVGAAHTCGIDTDGESWCWGANGAGQLGTAEDTTCDPSLVPEGFLCSTAPVRVAGRHRFVLLTAGRAHTCGIDDAGDAYCWGFGGEGRLGTGMTASQAVPALVTGGFKYASLEAGGSHTCGVTIDHAGYCWGSNSDGQLGSPDVDPACGIQQFRCLLDPHPVSGQIAFTNISVSDAVPIGGSGPALGGHSCGLATDGSVYCWGLNTSGQLLHHADLRSNTPVRIDTDQEFAQINAGMDNTCGITDQAEVLCWAFGGPVRRWYVFNQN